MKRILSMIAACLASCVLAVPVAPAAVHHHGPAVARTAAVALGAPVDDRTPNPPSAHAKMRAARKGRAEHSKHEARMAHVVHAKVSTRGLAEARKAAALEQAQARARVDHIYAVSQTNAPILADTSACKRIGAHGESIYENCAVLAANPPSR